MKSASSLFHKPKSLLCSKYEILIKYTLVPSVPLSIIAILSINPNTWMTSEIHHFYIELFAVILAAVLAFYYIARARTLNDKFSGNKQELNFVPAYFSTICLSSERSFVHANARFVVLE